MGRRRSVGVELPEGVQTVRKPSGKVYYYWAPQRSTKAPAPRVALGSDHSDPEFWRRLRDARASSSREGTFDKLIVDFKASHDFARLRDATRRDYTRYMDALSLRCGERLVADLSRADVYQLQKDMTATPVAANHMLSILQTIIEWGIPRDFRGDNPVIGVKRLSVEGSGATPWPEDGYGFVLAHAPTDLRRAAFLGRATGQRAGDLVRMRGAHLQADGIALRIGKRREIEHFVPLTKDEVAEIRSWAVAELDHFIKSTRDHAYTATHLNSRWNRWRDSAEAAPVTSLNMTLHGLRATKIADMDRQGVTALNIADELGMSVQMVSRYLRFSDKTRAARQSRDRRESGFQTNRSFAV